MSHFVVLVIGEDAEDQLAPYNENIRVEKYRTHRVSNREADNFIDFVRRKTDESFIFENAYKRYGKEYNDHSWQMDKDGVWWEYSTYNQKSKWDWYELGGRWKNFFLLKNGKKADLALKKDIDFNSMKEKAAIEAAKDYDKFMEVVKNTKPNKPWEYFSQASHVISIDQLREMYHSQPRIKMINRSDEVYDADQYLISREEFIENAANNSISTFAYLKDGIWYEKGQMGWFGISHDNKDQDQWNKEFSEMLISLSEDTLLSIYDCHI